MSAYSVIIVGAGPVGLGLGIELAQRDISVLLLERSIDLHTIPKGQNLTQRTGEHFAAWGVSDAIEAARVIPAAYGSAGVTAYRTLLGPHTYDWFRRADISAFYAAPNMRLPQYAMERVLRSRVAALPAADLRLGARVTEVDPGAATGPSVAFVGPDGSVEHATAPIIVGCDGARSCVRAAAGITQTTDDEQRRMLLAVFRSPELDGLLQRFPGKSYFNALHPDDRGYWRFLGRVDLDGTWFFHAPVPAGATRDTVDLPAILAAAVGAPVAVAPTYLGFWDLRFSLADTYRAGACFLAGDAAHSHPPYGGFGVNSGLEDARNLGWKLAATINGWGGDRLLDSYTAERHPVFRSTIDHFIRRMVEDDRDFLATFDPDRDPAAFAAEWARRATASKADVSAFVPNYRGSPIVTGGAPGSPSAQGTHSHEAEAGFHLSPLGGVYERLGRGFTLITASADAARDMNETAAARGIPLAHLAEAPPHLDAEVVLVRPDAFVAYAGPARGLAPDEVLAQAAGHG